VVKDGEVVDLVQVEKDRARELIEDFMVAANGVTARFLDKRGYPSIRRVVRSPKRWPRIVELAAELGEELSPEPDSRALAKFLRKRRKADPEKFPDLSLTVVKLMGAGEYTLDLPGQDTPGHFGLACGETDGSGGIHVGPSGAGHSRPFRPRRARLCPLDGA
jgi:exoribonuclease-2